MSRQRFGDVLARFIPLSPHDISGILEDQTSSRRRFGEIALALGLCKPQHIWRAWWAQLSGAPQRVDLAAIGVDAQCLSHLPRALALEYNVMPLRACGCQVVIAVAEGSLLRATEELPRRLTVQLKFVVADGSQVQEAIDTYYPSLMRDERQAPLAIPA